MGIGFSRFLFVLGAILTKRGRRHRLGVQPQHGGGHPMVFGLLGLLVSVLFWSSFSLEPSPDGGRRYGRGETPYRARASALT